MPSDRPPHESTIAPPPKPLQRFRWSIPAVALALALALLMPGFGGGQTQVRDGLTFAADDLERALDNQLVARQRPGGETRILLSFADRRGRLCRGFVRADLSGVACRRNGAWHLAVQRDGVDVEAGDPRQARAVDEAILAAAGRLSAGPPLTPAEEGAAQARGWRAQ